MLLCAAVFQDCQRTVGRGLRDEIITRRSWYSLSMQHNLAISLLLSLLRTRVPWFYALGCATKFVAACTRSVEQRPGQRSLTSPSSAMHWGEVSATLWLVCVPLQAVTLSVHSLARRRWQPWSRWSLTRPTKKPSLNLVVHGKYIWRALWEAARDHLLYVPYFHPHNTAQQAPLPDLLCKAYRSGLKSTSSLCGLFVHSHTPYKLPGCYLAEMSRAFTICPKPYRLWLDNWWRWESGSWVDAWFPCTWCCATAPLLQVCALM